MKLRNKKTGEIGELHFIEDKEYHFTVSPEDPADMCIYKKLADINEEWEDYEEPKDIWYIDWKGDVRVADVTNDWSKEIGNYFETKEEAEKAVEKLKAWKRLKDSGCKIVGWEYSVNVDLNGCKFNDDFIIGLSADDIDEEDLDLLFGDEE